MIIIFPLLVLIILFMSCPIINRYPNNVNDSIQVVAPKLTQEPTSQKINNDRPKLLILVNILLYCLDTTGG